MVTLGLRLRDRTVRKQTQSQVTMTYIFPLANGLKFVSTQLRLPSPILGVIGGHDYMQNKLQLKRIRIVDCASKILTVEGRPKPLLPHQKSRDLGMRLSSSVNSSTNELHVSQVVASE